MAEGKRFDANRWFRQTVDRRTREALLIQEQQFISEHAFDTDEQLAALIKARAKELKRSPQMVEVTGSRYMAERFGSWDKALAAAGQHLPFGATKLIRSDRYKAEYARQAALFKAEREQRKAERAARKAALAAQKKEREE